MADAEQLAVLREGVEAWNAWRGGRNHDVDVSYVDLSGADLSGANLSGANFGDANLSRADLSGANLSGANLFEAIVRGADLSGASLVGANLFGRLEGTDFTCANLAGADLCSTNLRLTILTDARLTEAALVDAVFREVNLNGTDFTRAHIEETVFADVDLSSAKGLDNCIHVGPSIIDHRTFQRSGPLPLSFLRGCGLPDNLIDYLPSLLNQAVQFYSCFISYSSEDDEFARRLYADLQNEGIRCWFAPEDMKIGDRIRTRIDEVIHLHEKLLLVLSEHSIRSNWVEKEVETAFEKEKKTGGSVLFPVCLDQGAMNSQTGWAADIRRSRHIGDFTNWRDHDAYRKSFNQLLRSMSMSHY